MIRALVLFSLLAPAVPNVAIGPDVESTARPVDAPIKTVIVFSDRAKIIRHGQAELGAGVTVLRLPDLPPAVSPTGLVAKIAPPARILRVEAQVVEREALELEQADVLLDKYEALMDEVRRIDAEATVLNTKLSWLVSLSPAPFVPEASRQGRPLPPLAPEAWSKALKSVADERTATRTRWEALVLLRRDKVAQLDTTRAELARVSPSGGTDTKLRVVVVVESPSATKAAVDLEYTAEGATWRPAYDLRYTQEDARVAIASYGVVTQATGERWDDVELKLSTAIPNQSIELPKLMTWTLGEAKEWIPQVRAQSAWPPETPRFAPPVARASTSLDEHRAVTMSRLALALSGAIPQDATGELANFDKNAESYGGMAGALGAGNGLGRSSAAKAGKMEEAQAPRARPAPRMAQRAAPPREMMPGSAPPPPAPPPPSVAVQSESVSIASGMDYKKDSGAAYRSLGLFEAPPPDQVQFSDPTLPAALAGGFDYVYLASTKMTVSQEDGEVRAPLGTFSESVDAFYRATPGITDTAFLTATVTNKTGRPFLAGPISLFLGSSFAGDAEMSNTGPGGKLELPMGADEDLRMKRRIIPATETTGIFSKDDITTYRVEIEAANFKKKTVKVEIVEPLPKTSNEKIAVELVSSRPKAAPDTDGILRYTLTIAPGKIEKIELVYRVKRPANWQLYQR